MERTDVFFKNPGIVWIDFLERSFAWRGLYTNKDLYLLFAVFNHFFSRALWLFYFLGWLEVHFEQSIVETFVVHIGAPSYFFSGQVL